MRALGQMLRRKINPVFATLLSVTVLIGVLVYMVLDRAAILRHGTEIVLKTAPIDPRDLMRGDYVRLRYEDISVVNGSLIVGEIPEQDGFVPLWLTLETGENGLAKVKSVSLEKPASSNPEEVYLKSEPVRWYKSYGKGTSDKSFSLEFGIERYYVPEGEGLEIEDARNAGRTTVAVRVSADGEPQIARLMIDGKTLYEEPLY